MKEERKKRRIMTLKDLFKDEPASYLTKDNQSIVINNNNIKKGVTYKGIEGWLFLLCFILIFINPLLLIINYIILWILYDTYINKKGIYFAHIHLALGSPSTFNFNYRIAIIFLATVITAYGFYAGIKLWRHRAGAVKIAKKYFIFDFCFLIVSILIRILMFPKIKMEHFIIFQALIFIYIIGWYLYLSKSKRIKATYEEDISSRNN